MKKNFRAILGIFIVVAGIYCGWKVLPPFISNYQLEESIDDAARFGAVDIRKTDQDLREAVLKEARGLNIVLAPEQVQVQHTYNDVLVWADYTVHIDMPLYPFDLHFQPMSKSKKRAM